MGNSPDTARKNVEQHHQEAPGSAIDLEPIYFRFKSVEFKFLSNFFEAPFELDGTRYQSVEHYFQSQKFVDLPGIQSEIISASSPQKAKKLGSGYQLPEPLYDRWFERRDDVMLHGLRAKFDQNPRLQKQLLATGERPIIENTNDSYWGRGVSGEGQNRLGVLLMALRQEIRAEQAA